MLGPSCHFDEFVMSTFNGKGVVLCCLQDPHEDWRAQWSIAQPLGDKPDRDVGHGKAESAQKFMYTEVSQLLGRDWNIFSISTQRAQDLRARRRGRSLSGFTVLFTLFGHCWRC